MKHKHTESIVFDVKTTDKVWVISEDKSLLVTRCRTCGQDHYHRNAKPKVCPAEVLSLTAEIHTEGRTEHRYYVRYEAMKGVKYERGHLEAKELFGTEKQAKAYMAKHPDYHI